MQINLVAVLISAIASMIIGSIWYGPLFGKTYMNAMGMNSMSPEKQAEMKKGMMLSYFWQFLSSLVMFYVLAKFVGLNVLTVGGGIATALWVWIGFMVTTKFGDALWGGKWNLFWIGIGGSLLSLLAAGIIIGALH